MKKLMTVAFALALIFTGCKKNSVTGIYKLDKEAMTKAMKEKIAKLPKKQQGFAKLMLVMVASMDVTVKLNKGGKAVMNSTVKFMGKEKKSEDKGTWKKDGDKILITTTQIRKRGKKEVKKTRTVSCTLKGKSLNCQDEKKSKKGPGMTLIFNKA